MWPALLALACFAAPETRPVAPVVPRIDAALARGRDFLLSRQSPDGAWRSETYGAFKDGYSLTPLVLSALLFAPADPRVEPAYRRGADFTATLAARTEDLSYPVYSLAGGVLVLSVPVNARHAKARDALVAALRAHQLADENGWPPGDPSYGGFGYFGHVPRRPAAGAPTDFLLSSNLSATLFAAGALAMAGIPNDDKALQRARGFVERCQSMPEGGFFMTPANRLQNKADVRLEGGVERFVPYGTMTADGLRALLRLGVARDDPRVLAARAWLIARFTPSPPPGDYPPDREVQRRSAQYYWAWTSAHALMQAGVYESPWPEALAADLLARQGAGGAWRNPATDLREDDPLLATSFAMAALSVARLMLTGQRPTAFPFPPLETPP